MILAVACRVLHIAATCTSLGGLFYARMVLWPNLDKLPEDIRNFHHSIAVMCRLRDHCETQRSVRAALDTSHRPRLQKRSPNRCCDRATARRLLHSHPR